MKVELTIPFKFNGIAIDNSGQKHSISIEVSSILQEEISPGCHCEVKCDLPTKRTIRIHGYSEGYIIDRTFNFLHRIFSFFSVSLEDIQGNIFKFDKIDMNFGGSLEIKLRG